ncbi:hypothetical protein C8Q74DRAFT_932616 [Fomes fomentarius]|nr:hypothetical protein C8Q74DRAFT_932616 [Fomes fomentarius]
MNSSTAIMEIDAQLCQLLGTMSLDGQGRKTTFVWRKESEEPSMAQTSRKHPIADAAMSDSSDSEDSTYQPSPSASQASSSANTGTPYGQGCAYLQAIHDQIRAGGYITTGGDYLETIFTHREALYAYPQGHRMCAVGFSELANDLARRERQHLASGWRPDWDGDSEAVSAFRHEAWVIANTL